MSNSVVTLSSFNILLFTQVLTVLTSTIKYNEYVTDKGENISIPCIADGNIMWVKENGSNNSTIIQTGKYLVLTNVSASDTGLYVCFAAVTSSQSLEYEEQQNLNNMTSVNVNVEQQLDIDDDDDDDDDNDNAAEDEDEVKQNDKQQQVLLTSTTTKTNHNNDKTTFVKPLVENNNFNNNNIKLTQTQTQNASTTSMLPMPNVTTAITKTKPTTATPTSKSILTISASATKTTTTKTTTTTIVIETLTNANVTNIIHNNKSSTYHSISSSSSSSSSSSNSSSSSSSSSNTTANTKTSNINLTTFTPISSSTIDDFEEQEFQAFEKINLTVRTPPGPVTKLYFKASTILGFLIWRFNKTNSGGYPVRSFTAEFRNVSYVSPPFNSSFEHKWSRMDPINIAPNVRQMEVYRLEPNTTYEFRIWANNQLGSGEVVTTNVTTLPETKEEDLIRLIQPDLDNFDPRIWIVAVSIVLGTFVILAIGLCIVLTKECYQSSQAEVEEGWDSIELIPNIILNPGFCETDGEPPEPRTIIFGGDEDSDESCDSESDHEPRMEKFKRKLSVFFTDPTINRSHI